MDDEISFCELRKREVVNAADGTRLGHIVDMIISVECKTALGIVAPVKKGGLFNKEQNLFIPLSCIVKIGEDVILINMGPNGAPPPPPDHGHGHGGGQNPKPRCNDGCNLYD